MVRELAEVLPKIAGHPLAIAAYVVLVCSWCLVLLRRHRIRGFLSALQSLPEAERSAFASKSGYRYEQLAQLPEKERAAALLWGYLLVAYISTLISVVLIVLTLIQGSGGQASDLVVSGVVIDSNTLKPIERAKTTLALSGTQQTAFTDSEGGFLFQLSYKGRLSPMRLTVRADEYNPYEKDLSSIVWPHTLDIRMSKLPSPQPLAVKPERLSYNIVGADDRVIIVVNDKEIANATAGGGWQTIDEGVLVLGPNRLVIKVYNAATRRPGPFGTKGEREGWNYNVDLRTDHRKWSFTRGNSNPGAEEWGTTFDVENKRLMVDPTTGFIDITTH